jgi:hypothetical protein
MRNSASYGNSIGQGFSINAIASMAGRMPRQVVIGVILILALVAFEMFNFDTTRYALNSLLGEVRFAGLAWATILAVAFCAIDFAGLARLFTPERGTDEPKEIWYLTGAWLLGATMNALMTWWAVSLTLLNHDLGNEVMSREQLLKIVPVFVALLVWLTRILFIGAVTAAGERLLHSQRASRPGIQPKQAPSRPTTPERRKPENTPQPALARENAGPLSQRRPATTNSRVRQSPPRPAPNGPSRVGYNGIRAARRNRR